MSTPIPPPAQAAFHGAIRHPNLWLWDSWTIAAGERLDLYCLALARTDAAGAPIQPADRNRHTFHVRRFQSNDAGRTWRDCGAVVRPAPVGDGYCARNIWSGSAIDWPGFGRLHALTGIRARDAAHPFLQTLFVAGEDANGAIALPDAPVLCPERDARLIRAAGYYLPADGPLGAAAGEQGGPILAWRDPFLFRGEDGGLEMIWSAKIAPATPALGHARLAVSAQGVRLAELLAPVVLPDASLMTQAEVPKLARAPRGEDIVLLIAACDRQREDQPDCEVSKALRLYRGRGVRGPWRGWRAESSLLADAPPHAFGASILSVEGEGRAIEAVTILAPITEQAAPDLQLTIGAPTRLLLAGSGAREPASPLRSPAAAGAADH